MKKKQVILIVAFVSLFLLASAVMAQTPGGTVITNQATVTYTDGTNALTSVSNIVTTTVSNVAGIAITPDAGANPSIVASQTGILFEFALANTGNITDNFLFQALGGSVRTVTSGTTTATITQAVIDVNGSSTIDGSDTDILTNPADVTSAAVPQGGSIMVLVEISINAGASPGDTVQVLLGDDASQPANLSANEVRTVDGTTINARQEDVGDITATVQDDAQLLLTATVPAGPVALGSNIAYSLSVDNNGGRDATGQSFNVDGGPQVGILVSNPTPTGTQILGAPAPTAPAGYTVVYTTDPLTTTPSAATWTSTAPPLASVRRIGFFDAGGTIPASSSSGPFTFSVIITTADATSPIPEIADVFAQNFVSANITDQSGDAVTNVGDLNADFTEGTSPGNVDGDGIVQYTLLIQLGDVLLGPAGTPGAVHTTDDDDFTDQSSTAGNGLAPGSATSAASTLVYTNTLENLGNADDTFRVTAPTLPAGFTVTVDPDAGGPLGPTTVSGGGFVDVPVAYGSTQDITVTITAPAGITVLTAYGTVLEAESQTTPGATNQTVDNFFAGFLELVKTVTVTNGTGVGGATDPVPGAEIQYDVTYTNVATVTAGAGNVTLIASSVVITEDGNAAPNNWASNTDHVSASATLGIVTDNAPTNTVFNNLVASLAPGASGTFTVVRTIQ
jgi:hypothetical protein